MYIYVYISVHAVWIQVGLYPGSAKIKKKCAHISA